MLFSSRQNSYCSGQTSGKIKKTCFCIASPLMAFLLCEIGWKLHVFCWVLWNQYFLMGVIEGSERFCPWISFSFGSNKTSFSRCFTFSDHFLVFASSESIWILKFQLTSGFKHFRPAIDNDCVYSEILIYISGCKYFRPNNKGLSKFI